MLKLNTSDAFDELDDDEDEHDVDDVDDDRALRRLFVWWFVCDLDRLLWSFDVEWEVDADALDVDGLFRSSATFY